MASFTPRQCVSPGPAAMAELGGDVSFQVAQKIVALADLKPGSIVHDNACGIGVVTLAVIEVMKPSEVTIYPTDLNPKMCEATASQIASKGWAGSVTTATMPAEALTFNNNFFSHSFSNFLIQGARDPGMASEMATNIYRTLKPGGTAIVTSWATYPHIPAILEAHAATRGSNVFHGMSKVGWYDPLTLEDLLKEAGFMNVRVEQCEAILVVPDLKRWCLIAWSWFGGNCDGGWREEDEGRFEQAIEMIHDRMLETEGIELDETGGARWKTIANIAVGWKAQD